VWLDRLDLDHSAAAAVLKDILAGHRPGHFCSATAIDDVPESVRRVRVMYGVEGMQ
jgi:hypothetical protein